MTSKYQLNKRKVKRFSKLMRFAGWLQNLPNKVTPPPFRLLQIGSAFWQSRLLYIAAKWNIASLLADEVMHIDAIALQLKTDRDGLYRLLRFLSALGIFTEVGEKKFSNNKLSDCLRDDVSQSVRAMILMQNSDEMSLPWYQTMEQGLQSGVIPFKLAHGTDLFSYIEQDNDFSSVFSDAMHSVEALSGDFFATDFNWSCFTRLIDLGGSTGSKAIAILKNHTELKAEVIDDENTVLRGEQYWSQRLDQQVLNRLRFYPGDILKTVPVAESDSDVFLLSAVLHAFDDKTCEEILINIADAIGKTKAKLAILEMVVAENQPDFASVSFDMQMFMGTSGRERSLRQWSQLVMSCGFKIDEEVMLQGMGEVLLLSKQ